VFPTCLGGGVDLGYGIYEGDANCSLPQYVIPRNEACPATPHDTIDYYPIEEFQNDTAPYICTPAESELDVFTDPLFFGLESGFTTMPPYTEVQSVRLVVEGTVSVRSGDSCLAVGGASIDVWHVDPRLYTPGR
jgi:hypothetical protein